MTSEANPPTVAPPESLTHRYALASIPEPFRILGLRLLPFSLGHYLLLQRFNCGFLDANEKPSRADLFLGVLICSMRHRQFLDFIEQKDFEKQIEAWGRKVGVVDLEEKQALFACYLRNSLAEPDYIVIKPGDEEGDWAQSLKMTLVTRLNYSDEEALDMPLSKALADYFKLAESEGLLRLITPEERAAGDANAAALAAFAQRKEAPCPA